MDMNSFLSWGTLGTFAGATACTGLFTQLLKSIIKKVPTQWLSFLIALVLLAGYNRGHRGVDAALDRLGVGAAQCAPGELSKQWSGGRHACDEGE